MFYILLSLYLVRYTQHTYSIVEGHRLDKLPVPGVVAVVCYSCWRANYIAK